MKLSTKLLLGYILVLGLVGGSLALALPRVAERAMLRASAQLLARQAEQSAQQIARLGQPALRTAAHALGATYLLMDLDGTVRAAPRGSFLTDLVGYAAPPELARIANQALEQGQATAIFSFREVTLVAAAVPVRFAATRPGGVVLLFQPAQDLDPAIRQLTRSLLTYTLIGSVAAVLLAALLGRMIVRRLTQVRTAAAALAEGDLSRRVPAEGSDELADLARSFNHMAGRLEQLVSGLRTSEELRRELMAAIAHELRTPVTSIRGFAEALQDGMVPPEKQPHYFDIIAGESARLSRLIQDLFDLAKLEAGQLEFRMQAIDLPAWLERFAAGVRPRVEGAGLRLETALSPAARGLRITGDQDRLEQVLHNLVENAIRFSPPGGTIRLELTSAAAEAGAVAISVSDQGPGVQPEEQARIWERFYQGRDRSARPGGAGLGLAIVRSIVEAHGGRVGLESRPGQGARFWFSLPVSGAALPAR